ncbi:MAG TPA: energy transducer TonB [Usitatibacter sp.]|nr:energy transducer TonB [Usitatibacter sp.]
MNPGEAACLASVLAAPGSRYSPSSPASRAGVLSLIVLGHAVALLALVSLGHVVLEIVQPPLIVSLLPEPPRARPTLPPPPLPMPQLRKPEVVIPEPPRFEMLAAVQLVERPAPPPPPAPAPVQIAAAPAPAPVVAPPRHDLAYLRNPPPAYPVFAKRAREEGKVILRVQVDASGQVAGIEIHQSSGFERLDKAALAAVRRWRFEPARSGNRAIAGVALVPINFQLEG